MEKVKDKQFILFEGKEKIKSFDSYEEACNFVDNLPKENIVKASIKENK
jgi:hypothetical protein